MAAPMLAGSGVHEFCAAATAHIENGTRARFDLITRPGEGADAVDPANLPGLGEAVNLRVDPIDDVSSGVPAHCRVVLSLGPQRPLSASEAAAIATYLDRGGAVLLAADAIPRPDGAGLAPHGLELVLARYGVRTPDAVVLDADPSMQTGMAHTWATARGYAEHPVTAGFAERRLTVWPVPRPVLGDGRAERPAQVTSLVRPSERAWAETQIDALFDSGRASADDGDRREAVPVAAAIEDTVSGGRIVVLGSARALATDFVANEVGANAALAASSVAWLSGTTRAVELGDKTPERVRLVMTRGQLRAVGFLCVILLPLAAAAAGGAVWYRRRRG